jgi:ABC-type lipoprotein export system ATPase subunit
MQETKPIIELVNVHKNYGKTQVLKGLNLTVEQGEFVSIRGKSGVGKTNLFKIIGMLETPNQGTVNLFGKDTYTLNDNQKADLRLKQIGLVFQFFNLLPTLTVRENIELPMSLNGTKKPDRQARANELLKSFELTNLADRYPGNLSGGERQRVSIMRALVNYPALLLADEPTSSLDDENSALLLELLCSIQRDQKVTIILTSTDLYEKLPTTKDYLLKEGQIRPTDKI